jgi:uncharacterized protein YjbI with pentapeptide repeats
MISPMEVNEMANQEHLDILGQGVDTWNRWRHEHPDIHPDLQSAGLHQMYLNGVDLSETNFLGANLSETDLSGADLRGANLSVTHLRRADLRGANLSEAELWSAYLGGANLSGANLSGANLSEADLHGANLHKANLSEADLSDADLRKTHFIEAHLSEADLSNADLSDASLERANLSGANLSGANLERANLSGAYLIKTKLNAAQLNGANFYKASLIEADLSTAYLIKANLSQANFKQASLSEADLSEADLSEADLSEANLERADFSRANLTGANLRQANLKQANLNETNFTRANLYEADLIRATLVRTNLTDATLTNCRIYGISAWDIHLERVQQFNLVITPLDEPNITVDNLEVAQFIYLLLNNKKIRDVIDTITSKVVLILGRFMPERKAVLDAIRDELRKRNYSPVLFDFEKPANRDLTETVSTLAHLARFIIVDLTDPSSAPHEVATIIPQCVVPVQPLLSREPLIVNGNVVERHEYVMFEDLRRRYSWVLPTIHYQDTADLLTLIKEQIIDPAEQKAQRLAQQ